MERKTDRAFILESRRGFPIIDLSFVGAPLQGAESVVSFPWVPFGTDRKALPGPNAEVGQKLTIVQNNSSDDFAVSPEKRQRRDLRGS